MLTRVALPTRRAESPIQHLVEEVAVVVVVAVLPFSRVPFDQLLARLLLRLDMDHVLPLTLDHTTLDLLLLLR